MLRLFALFALLVSTPPIRADPTDAEYGLGLVAETTDFKLAEYDVVIFVNDAITNLGAEFSEIEKALVRYNGVSRRK